MLLEDRRERKNIQGVGCESRGREDGEDCKLHTDDDDASLLSIVRSRW